VCFFSALWTYKPSKCFIFLPLSKNISILFVQPLQYFYYCCLLVFAFSLKKRDIIVMTSREVMPSAKNFPEESIFYTYPKGMDFHKRKR